MKCFAVVLNYIVDMEIVDRLRPSHREHLKSYYDSGMFLVSGPRTPRFGGFILAKANSRAEVDDVMKQDPFITSGAADYIIYEFDPIFHQPEFKTFFNKT